MFYMPGHSSMQDLVDNLRRRGIITSDKVYKAMLSTDRADFISSRQYNDSPQYISHGATISAPHMHAYALEYLKDFVMPGKHVLDVGSGSGYLTVALSKLMSDEGVVVGVEHIQNLFDYSKKCIEKSNRNLLETKRIILYNEDGRKGCTAHAPYSAIHVGAAAERIPEELINQLDFGGRMFIPVGPPGGDQNIYVVDKNMKGEITRKSIMGVSYVPLTSVEKQLRGK